MSLPDDLAEAVDNYLRAQEAPPTLTVVQTGLREYLRKRGFPQVHRPLKIRRSDVTKNHDLYLASIEK